MNRLCMALSLPPLMGLGIALGLAITSAFAPEAAPAAPAVEVACNRPDCNFTNTVTLALNAEPPCDRPDCN